jgi:hypothetical protein
MLGRLLKERFYRAARQLLAARGRRGQSISRIRRAASGNGPPKARTSAQTEKAKETDLAIPHLQHFRKNPAPKTG